MLPQLKKKVAHFWLPILAGFFIGTSYIPFPPWAGLFCFVPLWLWWWRQSNLKMIWWGGWVTQFVLTLIGFNWVAHTVNEFGHLPWPAALLTLILYAGFANLHVPLAGVLWYFAARGRRDWAALLLLPASVALLELCYPMIFDWHFGYTWLWIKWPAYHLAELVGFKTLSLITIFLNAPLFIAWRAFTERRWQPVASGLMTVALALTALTLMGMNLRQRLPTPDRVAHVLLVQANIGNTEKQEVEKGERFRDDVIDRYLSLTEEGFKHLAGELRVPLQPAELDFVIWPETAFPHLLNEPYLHSTVYASRLRAFLIDKHLRLVTGGYGFRDDLRQPTNSLYFLNEKGELSDRPYDKTRLLAFGEYFPGAQFFPQVKNWFPEVADFARGGGPAARNLGNLRLGPLICYEGLFDDFGRALGRDGAHMLVNSTNDSWYGEWQEPYQHLYMTLARAVEIRRPVVRATNTGISTVALADGTVLEQSPLQVPWTHLYDISYYSEPPTTWFMGAGYFTPWAILALCFALALRGLFRARTAKP